MTVVVGLVVGAITVQFLRVGASKMLASPVLMRRNYRDAPVPTAGGILIVLAVLVIEAGRAIFGSLGLGDDPGLTIERSEVLFAVFGFGLLGLIDDLLGDAEARGFRGHLGALFRGEITTGFLKLFGGAGVAVVLVATPSFASGRRLLVDAVLIALAANLGNLLDRAPGRTIKAAAIAYIPLAFVLGEGAVGIAIAPVMGAAFGLFGDDARERLMLGDAGANVIGAVLGLGVVLGRGEVTRITALVVLVIANVAAEIVSFSKIIERVPALRAFDRLGRRRLGRRQPDAWPGEPDEPDEPEDPTQPQRPRE
jgi:UDP-N-acetylmuramyl pentapeptide phosphotransferase/UDP-N-acetylglucosamine-1-phosphate transferase